MEKMIDIKTNTDSMQGASGYVGMQIISQNEWIWAIFSAKKSIYWEMYWQGIHSPLHY